MLRRGNGNGVSSRACRRRLRLPACLPTALTTASRALVGWHSCPPRKSHLARGHAVMWEGAETLVRGGGGLLVVKV